MNTNLRIAGALSCALLMTACGPSPTKICDKMIELAKAEGSEALAKKAEQERDECVDSLTSAKEMQGAAKFNEQGKCIMKASSLADAVACRE